MYTSVYMGNTGGKMSNSLSFPKYWLKYHLHLKSRERKVWEVTGKRRVNKGEECCAD